MSDKERKEMSKIVVANEKFWKEWYREIGGEN